MKNYILAFILLFSTVSVAASYPVERKTTPFSGSRLYTPTDDAKHTSIIILHGSEGGSEPFLDVEANILATQGYSVMVYCYFDCGRDLAGPKQTLKNVEVTTVMNAVAWFRKQPQSNGRVVVYGFSRGAELTMIVGSLPMTAANRPDALIAHSPSDVFNFPWNWAWLSEACWICKKGLGQCGKDAPESDFLWNPACGPDDPDKIDYTKSAWLINGVNPPTDKRIEIEKYDGPILITIGDKDEVWSADQTRRIEATLKAAGRNPEVHYFPNEGHVFFGAVDVKRKQIVLDFLQRLR